MQRSTKLKKTERYQVAKRLGSGGLGTLYECVDRQENRRRVAMKKIKCDGMDEANEACSEASRAMNLRHDNLLEIHDVFIQQTDDDNDAVHVCLIMPLSLCSSGDLAAFLQQRPQLTEERVVSYVRQLASAVHTMHQNRMMHRNLKPQNILLSDDQSTLFIAGLGLPSAPKGNGANKALAYMAPEVHEGQYDFPADVWSLGCIFYNLMTLEMGTPHHTSVLEDENYSKTVQQKIREKGYSPVLAGTVAQMLTKDPSARMAAEELSELTVNLSPLDFAQPDELAASCTEAARSNLPQLANHALASIANRACSDLTFKDCFQSVGGIPAIMESISAFPNNAELLTRANRALAYLAVSEDNKTLIASAGGIDPIIHSMKAFPNNAELLTMANAALWNLAMNDNNKTLIASAGGIDVIIRSMKAFPKKADLLLAANGALSKLAVNSNNHTLMISAGGIDAIIRSMKAFPNNAKLLSEANDALCKLQPSHG